MKINYYFILLFLIQIAHSQSEKIISGKVVSDNFPIAKVDVINITQNKVAITDNNGDFKITVKVGDLIGVFLKEYYTSKIKISQADLDANSLQINLAKKPIELDEVAISNNNKPTHMITQGDLDTIKLYKEAAAPKVIGVYDGTIPNGMDFVRIGKGVAKIVKGIFGSEDKPKKVEIVKFKDYLESNFKNEFYTNTLKLQPEDITVFKEYCDLDKQSIVLMQDVDYLRVYDFLLAKGEAFKKMRTNQD